MEKQVTVLPREPASVSPRDLCALLFPVGSARHRKVEVLGVDLEWFVDRQEKHRYQRAHADRQQQPTTPDDDDDDDDNSHK